MTFWEHLDALRGVLVRICVVMGVLSVAYFSLMPEIFDRIILWPCSGDFPLYRLFSNLDGDGTFMPDLSGEGFSVTLVNIKLASQFMIHMSATLWAAFITGFPLIIYLLWSFISPALYASERRAARKAFALGCCLFYAGVLTAYFLVFPMALRFLADYKLSESISNTVSIDSYMDTFYMLVLGMGLVFELPLLAMTLGRLGLITRSFFRKYRRHAIVALAVVSAIITPTGDPLTMAAVFVPLYALWELGGRLVPKKPVDDESESAIAGDVAGGAEAVHGDVEGDH